VSAPIRCPTAAWTLLLLAACLPSRAENQRAKARIFARVEAAPMLPSALPIDVASLAGRPEQRDRALEMDEPEAYERLGAFRLRGTLKLRFIGPGQRISDTEERLVEQSSTGNVHLRLLDESGGGMEILSVGGVLFGRSRYGSFTQREGDSGFPEQRDEVYGALKSLYLESNRAWQLKAAGTSQAGGRPCHRFELSLGPARPPPRPDPFLGRIDPDTEKRFQFAHHRSLEAVRGSLCFDDATGVPSRADVQLTWTAGGDAGTGRVEAELEQTVEDVGRLITVQAPESFDTIPHRPRGPAMALARFGFGPKPPDAGPEPVSDDDDSKN
jgi:hypothetical protein